MYRRTLIQDVHNYTIDELLEVLSSLELLNYSDFPSYVYEYTFKTDDYLNHFNNKLNKKSFKNHLEYITSLIKNKELDLTKDYVIDYDNYFDYDLTGVHCKSVTSDEYREILVNEILENIDDIVETVNQSGRTYW